MFRPVLFIAGERNMINANRNIKKEVVGYFILLRRALRRY